MGFLRLYETVYLTAYVNKVVLYNRNTNILIKTSSLKANEKVQDSNYFLLHVKLFSFILFLILKMTLKLVEENIF